VFRKITGRPSPTTTPGRAFFIIQKIFAGSSENSGGRNSKSFFGTSAIGVTTRNFKFVETIIFLDIAQELRKLKRAREWHASEFIIFLSDEHSKIAPAIYACPEKLLARKNLKIRQCQNVYNFACGKCGVVDNENIEIKKHLSCSH
jgi:hypothetical protein